MLTIAHRNSDYKAGDELNKFVEDMRETAKGHGEITMIIGIVFYGSKKGREKLYRTILLSDAYEFGDDTTSGKAGWAPV